jgi:hypothetical protein
MTRTLILVTWLLLPRVAMAQEPRQPLQELFFTEVVYPQEKGEIQLTLSVLLDRSGPERSGLIPLSIEYGVTDRWQIGAGWDGYTQFDNTPFKHLRTARASVGTKYSVMNIKDSPVHAAVGVDVEFPDNGAFPDDEGETGVEADTFIALAADLGRGVTLFGSGGYSLESRAATELFKNGERPDAPATVSFGALLAFHRATVALEYTNRNDGLPWRLDGSPLVTPSFVFHPGHQWELAAGIPFPLRGEHRHPAGFALNVIKEF